jgi:hypothetical protein
MYDLAQQVRQACHYACDTTARLQGKPTVPPKGNDDRSMDDLQRRITATLEEIRVADPDAFAGAEERNCNLPIPGGLVIRMNGLEFLRAWSLPHFYFHVVTAYDILRHNGVAIGKQDYLRQIGRFIGPQ